MCYELYAGARLASCHPCQARPDALERDTHNTRQDSRSISHPFIRPHAGPGAGQADQPLPVVGQIGGFPVLTEWRERTRHPCPVLIQPPEPVQNLSVRKTLKKSVKWSKVCDIIHFDSSWLGRDCEIHTFNSNTCFFFIELQLV